MPNRILKESICTSDTIDSLSPEEERFFYRLLVQCDDYGRLDARPSIVRSKVFPLKLTQISDSDICWLLGRLIQSKLIIVYIVDEKPFLQVVTWDKHQQIRAKKSKFPEHKASDNHLLTPDNIGMQLISTAGEINGNQLQSNVPVIQSNPIQSNPIPEKLVSEKNGGDPDKLDKHLLSYGSSFTEEKTDPPKTEIEQKMTEIVKIYTQEISPNYQGKVAEQLKEIAREYPLDWFRDACEIAAKANRRRLDYVMGVIARWNKEGRHDNGKNGDKKPKATDLMYWPNVR